MLLGVSGSLAAWDAEDSKANRRRGSKSRKAEGNNEERGEARMSEKKEGELKKRIQEQFHQGVALQYSPLRPQNQSEVAGMLKIGMLPNIEKILDEAKAEILSAIVSGNNPEETYQNIVKAFRKWFGSAEK
jgi:hypothetical protein